MSKIEVNTIDTQCGTALQVGCTNTTTIGLGKSGDTITVPAGATIQNLGTATGFGGTGVVSWDTASIKTTGFTAVTGTGYFCNTTGGQFTVTLPLSPSAGDVIGVADYAQNFATANLVLGRNGSNIGGFAVDSTLTTAGLAVTLVYVDGTKGWIVTDSGLASEVPGPLFLAATGGCITTDGDYKVHTFNSPGCFAVTSLGNPSGSVDVDYLVVAGGGGGGGNLGGGAGGGGYRIAATTYSPVPTLATAVPAAPVSVTTYPITVGAGGSGGGYPTDGTQGGSSSFSTITSAGGGWGGINHSAPHWQGRPGGSGGGGSGAGTGDLPGGGNSGGTGNDPPVSPPQGNNGGIGAGDPHPGPRSAGGGGGASAVGPGAPPIGGCGQPFPGANGETNSINGSSLTYAGGGGGATENSEAKSNGGTGGGGGGSGSPTSAPTFWPGPDRNGTTNLGGGGGGAYCGPPDFGGNGGSGVVIIRYKYQ